MKIIEWQFCGLRMLGENITQNISNRTYMFTTSNGSAKKRSAICMWTVNVLKINELKHDFLGEMRNFAFTCEWDFFWISSTTNWILIGVFFIIEMSFLLVLWRVLNWAFCYCMLHTINGKYLCERYQKNMIFIAKNSEWDKGENIV